MISALVGLLVGDYLLQNDWQAAGKKRSSWICAFHCALVVGAIALFSGWWSPGTLLFLFATHFLQDRTTIVSWWMCLVGQKTFLEKLGPWSSIVVDNVWHVVQLWVAWQWLEGGL